MEAKWFNVNEDARVWSGHSDGHHKQGWIYAPAAIRAIEEYQGSYKFHEWKTDLHGSVEITATPDYPEYWIRMADVSLEPYGEPTPDPDTDPVPDPDKPVPVEGDAELGAAVRTIVAFLASYFRD